MHAAILLYERLAPINAQSTGYSPKKRVPGQHSMRLTFLQLIRAISAHVSIRFPV